jgi:hypothetical protein
MLFDSLYLGEGITLAYNSGAVWRVGLAFAVVGMLVINTVHKPT